jgi:TonB family protein
MDFPAHSGKNPNPRKHPKHESMSEQWRIRKRVRRKPRRGASGPGTLAAAFARPAAAGAFAYPGFELPEDGGTGRRLASGSLALLIHLGLLGVFIIASSLAPVIKEELIPVQIIKEEPPPPPEEPAAAPKALAERRPLPFNPQVQSVAPQIVNPNVIAAASPAVVAEAIQMDAVNSVATPTQIATSNAVIVERVSTVNSVARATASAVDVSNTAPAVRGPTRIDAPVGASVGPRQVTAAVVTPTMGTGLEIGNGVGSSVAEGVVSSRDVIGSPDGALIVSVDTQVGDGLLHGPGGGDGTATGTEVVSQRSCLQRPAVKSYIAKVRDRTMSRWVLPPGVAAQKKVTLRFRIDAAGSTSSISVVRAEDNALGASAVDALRAASPFPAMPDDARCLTRVPIVGTFSNPVAG